MANLSFDTFGLAKNRFGGGGIWGVLRTKAPTGGRSARDNPTHNAEFFGIAVPHFQTTPVAVVEGNKSEDQEADPSKIHPPRAMPTSPSSKRCRKSSIEDDFSYTMLQTAIQAAKEAGKHMKANLGRARIEKTKSNKDDLVTIVDKQCQDLVDKIISAKFPDHQFLGEESVEPGSQASSQAIAKHASQEWLWIVDPIDGTTNFVHKRPASVVSVACAHKGQVAIGVIYDPYRDELFTAQRGFGAFLNGQQIHVSDENTFSSALIGFGIGTKETVREPMLDCVREFASQCRGIRVQGSAAMELAWTACGRETGFYELDLNSWDLAAGVLLVTEAGGKVTDSEGHAFSLNTRNIVASNGKGDVHDSLLKLIAKSDAVHVRSAKKRKLTE